MKSFRCRRTRNFLKENGRCEAAPRHCTWRVSNGHLELAAELLSAGADPNSDLLGYTPLHMLAYIRKPAIGDSDPGPEITGNISSLELAKRLVAKGANVNARMTRRVNLTNTRFNELGATPYLIAAVTADAEYMKALVELGADPLLTNDDGSTALDGGGGHRDAIAGRRRRHRRRSDRSDAGRARPRRRHQCR